MRCALWLVRWDGATPAPTLPRNRPAIAHRRGSSTHTTTTHLCRARVCLPSTLSPHRAATFPCQRRRSRAGILQMTSNNRAWVSEYDRGEHCREVRTCKRADVPATLDGLANLARVDGGGHRSKRSRMRVRLWYMYASGGYQVRRVCASGSSLLAIDTGDDGQRGKRRGERRRES